MVRPFAVNCADPMLSADEVTRYSRKVEAMDKTNHPEWFGAKRKKLGAVAKLLMAAGLCVPEANQ